MVPAFLGGVVVLAACFGWVPRPAVAAESQAQTPPAPSQAQAQSGGSDAAGSEIDVRKLFASQCAWCHADYGLKPGRGPRLAGTRLTEKQVYNLIRNGKEDAMPAFRRTLTEEQLQAFTKYVKELKVPE